MRPLALLNCVAKALVRHTGNLIGFGWLGDIVAKFGEEIWDDWRRLKNEEERRAELAAIVQMAAAEFRVQVREVVCEVAAGEVEEVRQRLASSLEQLPNLLRRSLRRPADRSGSSVPPDLRLQESQDLIRLLSSDGSGEASVVIAFTSGPRQGERQVIDERATYIIGRAKDCTLRIRSERDEERTKISRHHCLLDINPPDISIRDLGSRSGTFVNGELIGKRPKEMDRDEGRRLRFPERMLHDGDEVKLGKSGVAAFYVSVTRPAAQTAVCVQCGQAVSGESGRAGEYVCSACRQNPEQIMASLQEERSAGLAAPAIHGYRVIKRLGQGGMGTVWLARHERSERLVAIKVMLPKIAASEKAVQRFLREMTSTRILNQRHVVRFFDTGYAGGAFFIVLEYCDGGSVAELVHQRGGTLPVDEAIEITLQALTGLHYAHNVFGPGKGLVHRDFKPPNIFLAGSGSGRVAKIGDYGLAKAFDDAGLSGLTRTGEVAGTPHFMARQQVLEFKNAPPEVDVWAAAASLYWMLTGCVPRRFPRDQDPWLAVLENDSLPIRQWKPDLPEGLARVIDHALREEPHVGFRTAAEFKDALEESM